MIKVIMTILAGAMLWLGALGHAQAAIPMFVEKANQLSVEEFRVFFQKANLLDLEGNVRVDDMGRKLHPVFKDKLHEAAAKDEQSLAREFVSMYGLTVPLEKLYEQAKVGKIVLPDAVLTAPGTAEPAVAAASAPIAPATPVAVSEAPAPVAKPLPTAPAVGGDNAKEQMFAELRKQRAEIEADIKGSRKAAFDAINHAVAEMGKTHKVTKQEMERFVTEAVKSFEKDPADQKAIKDAVIKVAAVDAKIKALDEVDAAHSASIARLGGRQLWQNIAIGLVGFLVILGLAFTAFNWRRTTKTAQAVVVVAERVEDVAEKAGVHGSDLFDKAKLKLNLATLSEGDMHTLELTLDGEVKSIAFEKMRDGKVKVYGIADQTQSVKVGKVVGVIYDAAKSGRIVGATTAPVASFKAAA